MSDAFVFAMCFVYFDNLAWFNWASSYLEMVMQAWNKSLEKR